MVCLVADRDLSARGVQVDFFGEPTRMPAGPAMLAAVTGAAFCPTHIYNTDTGWAGDDQPAAWRCPASGCGTRSTPAPS